MTLAAETPGDGLWRSLRVNPCGVLLAVQLFGIVLYPFLEGSFTGRTIFSIFQLGVLLLAVAAVRLTPALTWLAMLLGAPAMVFTVLTLIWPDNVGFGLASDISHAAFFFHTAYGFIRYMFADDVVGSDELFATGACFTVVAWGFAYVFSAIQTVWGASQFMSPHSGQMSWLELLFLSFTTMTSTGLSDVSPVGAYARSAVMLEQLAGVHYVALVVARLVGITLTRFKKHDTKPERRDD